MEIIKSNSIMCLAMSFAQNFYCTERAYDMAMTVDAKKYAKFITTYFLINHEANTSRQSELP